MEAGICGWESPHRRSPSPARAPAGAHPELRCAALRAGPRTLGRARQEAGWGQGRATPAEPRGSHCGGRWQRDPPRAGGAGGAPPLPPRSRGTRVAPAQQGGRAVRYFPFSPSSRVNWRGLSVVKISASSKGGKPRRAGLF